MRLDVFTYDLPPERIAQRPIYPPDAAKLLIINRASGELKDEYFYSLQNYLNPGDRLIFNDTAVIPARLFGTLPTGGECELLLIKEISSSEWRCMGRPLRRMPIGASIAFGNELVGIVAERLDREIVVRFEAAGDVRQAIVRHGIMPIPPYIRDGKADEQDRADYQTIFAKNPGSIAAPTASLHFTESLLKEIDARGVNRSYLTLHVGTASFLPVVEGDSNLKPPGKEEYKVDERVVREIRATQNSEGRVIPVGTTALRAIESYEDELLGNRSETELFITPGYKFKRASGLITNFHQPGTTHLLIVEALLGRQLLEKVYQHALDNGYRFLSYGDGMLIV